MTWVLEIFQRGLGQWMPLLSGDEEGIRERYEWYKENRPDLYDAGQLNMRDEETDPTPPQAPEFPDG